MLAAVGLACARGERLLLRDIDFALAAGTLLTVRGANGSGKTTLLRAIAGLLAPAAGAVHWRGTSIAALGDSYREALAYIGHQNALKDELTPAENLQISEALAGRALARADALAALALLGLAREADLPTRVLSQGQRRRAALARLACRARAPLWVLDEPFVTLDDAAVRTVTALIEAQLERAGVVVLTTHQDAPIAAPQRQALRLA